MQIAGFFCVMLGNDFFATLESEFLATLGSVAS